MTKISRTSQGLRDVLFDEINELRGPKADPTKSLAVAKVAQQIISTVKVELQYQELADRAMENKMLPRRIGGLQLGSELGNANGAEPTATAQ